LAALSKIHRHFARKRQPAFRSRERHARHRASADIDAPALLDVQRIDQRYSATEQLFCIAAQSADAGAQL